MKHFLHTTLLTAFAMCSSVSAQDSKGNKATSQPVLQAAEVTQTIKSQFVNSQNYLSASSLKDYKTFYGDSLKGFDEASVKARLLSANVYGQEYITALNANKRLYIDQKYNVGSNSPQARRAAATQQNTTHGGRQIGGNNSTMTLPCINEGFESTLPGAYTGAANATAIQGWTLSSYTQAFGGCATNAWTLGAPEAWIVQTPVFGLPGLVTLPNSPLGGSNVLRLNDQNATGLQTKVVQTFPVTSANTLFQFAFAGIWQDGGHPCCEQPALKIAMYDCNGAPLTCSSLSLNATGPGCAIGSSGYSITPAGESWTNWQVKYIDLTPFVGTCVTLELKNGDCTNGGHYGTLFLDAQCGGQVIGQGLGGTGGPIPGPVSYCAGSNQAIIAAPLGYAQYQWVSPITGLIPPSMGGAAPTLTVMNPIPTSVYTVNLTTGSGCHFTSTNTITTSNVNILAIGAGSTCAGGGSSGTATVVGSGSGSGYTYNWVNTSNVTVGTTSMITGLTAGLYSVTIGGLGIAGCGNASGTVVVGVSPTPTIGLLKPYCSGAAYLAAPLPGTNHKWYNGNIPIGFALGGNAPTYTVASPCNLCVYWLSYLSSQGCQDSVKFTLTQSPPGLLTVPNPGTVCPGGANGSPTITLFPATGAPSGQNAFTVTATGTTPAYTAAVTGYNSNNYSPTGLAAGTYSIAAFDGSCKYSGTFGVQTLNFNFALTPSSYTLCTGTSTIANMIFPVTPALFQYTYNWAPATFLSGTAQQLVIMSPTAAPGVVSTIIYTATATSSLMNCPVSHTVALTVINPTVPIVTPIPNLCDNGAPYTITVTPGGGTFSTSLAPNLLVNSTSGAISPTYAAIGTNTFSYKYAVNICTISTVGSFHVSHYNSAALTTPNLNPMCITDNGVNLMNYVLGSTGGAWSGPGVVGTYTFDPSAPSNTYAAPPNNINNYVLTYTTASSPIATVCPASSTLGVSVTNTVLPLISPVPDFCTNHGTITLTATPPGGGWSGNGIPTNGVFTPSTLSQGAINVTYTVTSGACTNSNSIVLNVSQYYPAGFTGVVPDLCYSNSSFDLNTIAESATGSWAITSNFQPVITTSLTASYLNPQPFSGGQYVITHNIISNPAGLCNSTATIMVNIANPPTPTISLPATHCSADAPFHLTVIPNTGSWVPTSYLTAGGLFTPSLAIIGNNSVQYVIGTSTCPTQGNSNAVVEAFVPAAITTASLPDKCTTSQALNLSSYALSGGGSWSGQGVTGSSFNPGATGAGIFTLTHNTSSSPSQLCPDQATVTIHVYSLPLPILGNLGPLCTTAAPQRIQPSPAGGIFGGVNTNAISNDGLFVPAQALPGANIISYSITLGPCIAFANTTITIEKFVPAEIGQYPAPAYCSNAQPTNLDQFALKQNAGVWGGPAVVNGMFNFANATIGKNVVFYKTSSATASLCPDVSSLTINVEAPPVINVSSDIKSGCAPLDVKLSTNSNLYNGIGKWTLNDRVEGTGPGLPHTFTAPGSYSVVFTLAGTCTVQAMLDKPITVYENPTANFTFPDDIKVSDTEVQFTNLSTENTKNQYHYQWKFSNAYTSTEVSPTVTFAAMPGKYTATLTAISVHGCKNESVKNIEVRNEFNIFIPTSFTPNFDGLNDYFKPVFTPFGLDEKTFEMEIFDRWGSSLFRSKDPAKGWDGSIQNKGSEMMKEEVYVYRIKYKDMEGNVYNKIGHVSLIR